MATVSLAIGLRTLFAVLGTLMLATLLYTLITDGLPFRKDLLTPWMAATLIDFYINVVTLSAWVVYKEANWISSLLWIILLVCFGSITTSAYIVVQFLKLSSEESSQDPMYNVMLRHPHNVGVAQNQKESILWLRFYASFSEVWALSCSEPWWMAATLVDFYINVVALSVWVAYKESSWIYAVVWVVLLICFGRAPDNTKVKVCVRVAASLELNPSKWICITTCFYIVWQLFQISCQDPAYLILVHRGVREENNYKGLSVEAT